MNIDRQYVVDYEAVISAVLICFLLLFQFIYGTTHLIWLGVEKHFFNPFCPFPYMIILYIFTSNYSYMPCPVYFKNIFHFPFLSPPNESKWCWSVGITPDISCINVHRIIRFGNMCIYCIKKLFQKFQLLTC